MFEEQRGCLRLEHSLQVGGQAGKAAGAKLCSFVRTLIFFSNEKSHQRILNRGVV